MFHFQPLVYGFGDFHHYKLVRWSNKKIHKKIPESKAAKPAESRKLYCFWLQKPLILKAEKKI